MEQRLGLTCHGCNLCKARTQVVWGQGSIVSGIMMISGTVGQVEDLSGTPFGGLSAPAGKFLAGCLESIRVNVNHVWLTNTVKCLPPRPRCDPSAEEAAQCSKHLTNELQILKPRFVVTLGRQATAHILKQYFNEEMDSLPRHVALARQFYIGQQAATLYPLYHPTTVLRNRNLETKNRQHYKGLQQVLQWQAAGGETR